VASHIYVIGVGASPDRVHLFTEAVAAQSNLDVLVDPSAGGDADYSEFYYDAALVVLAWGGHLNEDDSRRASHQIDWAFRRGLKPMVVVKLDLHVVFPEELTGTPIIDLGNWTGGDSPELTRLVHQLEEIVSFRLSGMHQDPLPPQFVDDMGYFIGEMSQLETILHRLKEVMHRGDVPMADLEATLWEIGDTYRVLKAAIDQFMAAGFGSQGMDRDAFLRLERGKLKETIHNSRAHCGRIGIRYSRQGGIQQTLKSLLNEKIINKDLLDLADSTFRRLAISDFDMLAAMDELGNNLSLEARSIVNLLVSGQEELARQRAIQARERLLPLEDKVDAAVARFKEIESSIGYAEDRAPKTGGIHVHIETFNWGGTYYNSNVVIAEVIKNTVIRASAPEVPTELRGYLSDLAKAIGEISTKLPDDEAELAGEDLETLTEQAISAQPKWAKFERAAKGLTDVATKMAAAGIPIIDLINRVRNLVS
jgi:hypothetical protein